MSFLHTITSILTTALSLLGFVQANPSLPQPVRDSVTQNVQQVITQATNALASQNAEQNWKLYASIDYGFQISYPSTFKVDETRPAEIYFTIQNFPDVIVGVGQNKDCSSYNGDAYRFIKNVQLGQETFMQSNVSIDYSGMNSPAYVEGYCIVKNGTVYEIHDRSGGKDAQIQRMLQSIVFTSKNLTPISVSGMSKYTDADFGFSFWYPSRWQASNTVPPVDLGAYPGGTVIGRIVVTSDFFSDIGFNVLKYSSPGMTVTDFVTVCPMGNCRPTTRYYFDRAAHTWMMEYPNGTRSERDGSYILMPGHLQSADVSNNTMGGLHVFTGGVKSDSRIVPLSAHNFLIIVPRGYGVYSASQIDAFVETIVATDPDVATPVSAAEQVKTIQAEKDAYANQ